MRYILTAEGKIEHNAGTFAYQYFHKDHLGNTRVTFKQNGEIVQTADYYPFGLRHEPMALEDAGQKYLYNGKELQEELQWYDYGARMYDAALGRWFVPDPLAEKAQDWTPFRYSFNNPILFIDPTGLWEYKFITEGKGKDAKASLQLVKTRDDDNLKTFLEDSGLSEKEVEKLVGKELFNSFNDQESFAISDMKGGMGKQLKQIEKAVLKYNKKIKRLSNANCFGTSASLGSTNTINRNSTMSTFDGFLKGNMDKAIDFDRNLNEDYSKESDLKMGDIRTYTAEGETEPRHAATVLLKNNKGTQVFYKRNGNNNASFGPIGYYFLNYEKDMKNADNYHGPVTGKYRKK